MSVLKSVYEDIKGLYEAGLVDYETLLEFQELCNELPPELYKGLHQAKLKLGKSLDFDLKEDLQQLDDISS